MMPLLQAITRQVGWVAVIFFTITIAAFAAADSAVEASHLKPTVNTPAYTTKRVPIKTTEGTWLNVTVSPDGKQLAFDLLGDIYLLPITGGKATALTSGIAWDMQPQFSPDGKTLAFTSDQGGGDNIWLINTDGSQLRPVTQESFRLLNNPAWSPDGRFIAARKHFSSTRSNGAGEVWLYHINGGEGVPLVERPTQEKDLGEPAFAPQGQALYYSLDTTPGDRFEYNKDSTKDIYAIRQLDMNTKEVSTVLSGPGGAVRPSPSPDGKQLAFVQRRNNQSALVVKDLHSGKQSVVYRDLDRDMQETWAIYGLYPSIAWMPDGRELVFWAGGKLHRVNVRSGEHQDIPFEVDHYRDIAAEPPHFSRKVAPKQFSSKMLRWLTLSPNGKQAVFASAGYLYTLDVPTGRTQRLTRQQDHFEFYPSYSPDGRWIVYTTWHDGELGSVRKIRAKGGRSVTLTDEPGHYIRPLFAGDGESVYTQKIQGGYLRSPDWSQAPGIYRLGQSMQRIAEQGDLSQVVNGRVYFSRNLGRDRHHPQVTLFSTDANGHDLREHAKGPWISEFALSPDGQWLAFAERFQLYVLPFNAALQGMQLSAQQRAVPMVTLSDAGGRHLHWSADGQRLHWSRANQLFQQAVAPLFDAVAEDSPRVEPALVNETFKPSVLNVNLEQQADRPTGITALVGARILTMESDEPTGVIEEGTVLISGNRISAVGPTDAIVIPAGASTLDMRGKTIAPGLVDVHWHGPQGEQGLIPQQNWLNTATLAFGVTTLHDPFGQTDTVFTAAEMQAAGHIVAPRIYSTGLALYGAKAAHHVAINSLEDARKHIRRLKAAGAHTVKSYAQPRREQRQWVLQAAREEKVMVVAEGESSFPHNMTMIVDGHTGIEHALPVGAIYDDVKQLWRASDTAYTPTLNVAFGGIEGELFWYQDSEVWRHPLLSRYVPPAVLEPRARRREIAPLEDYNHLNAARITKTLADLGVSINLGSHGQREGLAAHWELWSLVQGGMTPHRALQAATLDSARYLGLDGDIGSLVPGKLADLVVFDRNPLEDIRQSEQIHAVMLNGRFYDAATMNEVLPDRRQHQLFYFKTDQ